MGGVVQFKEANGTASPIRGTFDATPTPGNTILVVACSDTDVTLDGTLTRRANQIASDDYEVGTRLVQSGDGSAWGVTFTGSFNTSVIIVEVDGIYDATGTVAHVTGSQGGTSVMTSLTPGAGTITALAVVGCHSYQTAIPPTGSTVNNGFTVIDTNNQGPSAGGQSAGTVVAKKEGLTGSSAIGATTVTLSSNAADRDGVLVSFIDNTIPMSYARPNADTVITGWTNEAGSSTNIYASIDETSASDTDYIKATS